MYCNYRGERRRHPPAGNVIVLVAVSLPAVLGVVGLVIDGGRVMAERRHAQNASDAAAMAAAIDLYDGKTAVAARQTALTYADRNGYSNDGTTNTVTVNIPPLCGPNAGNANFVEVIAKRNVTTLFINFVNPMQAQPQSRGVAGWQKTTPGNGTVVTLNLKKKKTFRVKKGDLYVGNGPVQVNSADKKEAAVVEGGGTVNASQVKVNGGYVEKGGGQFNPGPTTGVAATADPLGLLKPPSTDGLPTYSKVNNDKGGTTTLEPGIYQGGIDINNGDVVMKPGIYVIQGGGMKIQTKGSLTANEVMIYNTSSNGRDYNEFRLKVDGDLTMTGPTSGDYMGLTLFQDRSNTKKVRIDLKGSDDLVCGTFYAANAQVEIKGTGSMDGAQIISNRFKLDGTGTVNLNYDPNKTAKIIDIALTE